MRSNSLIWIFVALVASAVVIMVVFAKPAVNWSAQYQLEDDHPYGISFLYDLLQEQYGEGFDKVDAPFHEVYPGISREGSQTLVSIGQKRSFDSLELNTLLNFVAEGNKCFLSASSMDNVLMHTLLSISCRNYVYYTAPSAPHEKQDDNGWSGEGEDSVFILTDEDIPDGDFADLEETKPIDSTGTYGYWNQTYIDDLYSKEVVANFEQPGFFSDTGYAFFYFYKSDTQKVYWNFFDTGCLDQAEGWTSVGGIENGKPNFIRVAYGSGAFYLHANPRFFTNVELLQKHRLEYSEKVFTYLESDHLIWDAYTAPMDLSWDMNKSSGKNPLSYILSQPPLRRALYLIILGSLLYIVFQAKRKQQVIPVIESNINTSMEFAEMLGQLYFEKKDHRYLAGQLWRQFVDYIRSSYYIAVAEQNADWMEKLALKSRVDFNRIHGIHRAYHQVGKEAYSESDLVNFYNKLKYFYSNCK